MSDERERAEQHARQASARTAAAEHKVAMNDLGFMPKACLINTVIILVIVLIVWLLM